MGQGVKRRFALNGILFAIVCGAVVIAVLNMHHFVEVFCPILLNCAVYSIIITM